MIKQSIKINKTRKEIGIPNLGSFLGKIGKDFENIRDV